MNRPPRISQRHVRELEPAVRAINEPDAVAIERRRSMALEQPSESLPVLEAFQEFLDAERRKTRKRLVAVSSLLFLAFLLATATGGFIGWRMIRRTRSRVYALSEDVRALQTATASQLGSTTNILAGIAADTAGLRNAVDQDRRQIEETSAQFASRVTDYDQQLARMAEIVQVLEQESTSLKTELDGMRSGLSTITNRMQQEPPHLAEGRPSGMTLKRRPFVVSLSLQPQGSEQAVEWRLPIPE